MKLINRKTNEMACFGDGIVDLRKLGCKNVAEMIEAGWEDYEEPKDYWYIDVDGSIIQSHKPTYINHLLDGIKSIGNYFETKEEAEKAVEKLKAWKRLKDARFKFTDFGYNLDEMSSSTIGANEKICFDTMCYEDFSDDLELLFGGEE